MENFVEFYIVLLFLVSIACLVLWDLEPEEVEDILKEFVKSLLFVDMPSLH